MNESAPFSKLNPAAVFPKRITGGDDFDPPGDQGITAELKGTVSVLESNGDVAGVVFRGFLPVFDFDGDGLFPFETELESTGPKAPNFLQVKY